MKPVAPLRIRVEKDIVVRINRILKGSGTFNVSENQLVEPSDIIGTAQYSAGFRILNLCQLLNVTLPEVEKYMKKSLGQRVYKDELLAFKSGGFLSTKKVVVSPSDGVLDSLNPQTGELKMTFLPIRANLPSGVYGVVEKIDKEKGQAIIRTQASLIYGMLGSGRVRDGMLHFISKRDGLVDKTSISTANTDQILVGGSLVFKEAISMAISAGVSGIITGGINAKDYKGMAGGRLVFPKIFENDIGISIIACEGFGSISIGEDIYDLLLKYENRFVSIDGNAAIIILPSFSSGSITKIKNTKLAPLGSNDLKSQINNRLEELGPGVKVRVRGNAFGGEQGVVIAVDQTETLLPSGIKAFLVTIQTRRRKIQVPVANIEILDYIL